MHYKNYFTASLPENFSEEAIKSLEEDVLNSLATDKKIKGLLLGLDAVTTTDPIDLLRLKDMLSCIVLMGARTGIFGVNPGLAAVIIKTNISLPIQAAGHDLEDLLRKLQ
jgi:anti-anti-sigma regulatory factor